MDLWIRSQDKKNLWKAIVITIQGWENTEKVSINVSSDEEHISVFAIYSSKQKALKVLDEIQKFINYYGNDQVFEMPADDTPPCPKK